MSNETKKPAFKVAAIAASAVLVAALAATGIVAYGQNNTGKVTMFDQTNATDTASTNMTETASNATGDTGEQTDKETFTASAVADSECSSVITVDDGTVSLNSTTTMTAEELSEEAETMTAGLNDTQVASLDQLIENACDAIRDGKSVTALGHLQTARDILSGASETETAEVEAQGEVEDEDEPGDIDVEDEDEGLETE